MKFSKRCTAWMLAAASSASLLCSPFQLLAAGDEETWIGSANLSDTETAAPAKDDVLPTPTSSAIRKMNWLPSATLDPIRSMKLNGAKATAIVRRRIFSAWTVMSMRITL